MLVPFLLFLALGGWILVKRGGGLEGPSPVPPMHISTIKRVLPYRDVIEEQLAGRSPVSVAEVMAIIAQESAGRPDARGAAGEVGLMQIKPDQALIDYNSKHGTEFDGESLLTPSINIEVGSWYYWTKRFEFKEFTSFHALRSYNAGSFGAHRNPEAGADYARSVMAKTLEFNQALK